MKIFKEELERYEEIASKYVRDADGFLTDYTMYYDYYEDRYVFVFGDSDLYRPEDEYFDWEVDTEAEAREWFDNYNGFDDLDESMKESAEGKIFTVNVLQNYPFNGFIEIKDKLDKNGNGEKHNFTNRKELNDFAKELTSKGYRNYQGYPLKEDLDNFSLHILLREVDDADDLEDLEELAHEIYWYDKALFAQINKFPPDKSLEEIKDNFRKHLNARFSKPEYEGSLLDPVCGDNLTESISAESLTEDVESGASNKYVNENLSESYDFVNYNDFLADNFIGYGDEDIDALMKDLNKCARALSTKAEKLIFYYDYNEDFYNADEVASVVGYIGEKLSVYKLHDSEVKFIIAVNFSSSYWIFKNEAELNEVITKVKDYVNSLNEGLDDLTTDFNSARDRWNELGITVDFDDALAEWNKKSRLAEPKHWYSKPIYSEQSWDDMVRMFSK